MPLCTALGTDARKPDSSDWLLVAGIVRLHHLQPHRTKDVEEPSDSLESLVSAIHCVPQLHYPQRLKRDPFRLDGFLLPTDSARFLFRYLLKFNYTAPHMSFEPLIFTGPSPPQPLLNSRRGTPCFTLYAPCLHAWPACKAR